MERRRERGKGGRRDRKLERWRPLCLFVSLSLCLSASLSLRLPTSGQRLEWGAQSSGALSKLSGVFFVDRDHGWIVGSNGTLLATVDGGAKWLRRTLPERQRSEALNDVWFFNPDRGLLLGEYGLFNRKGDIDLSEKVFLLISKDRGANWEAGTLRRPPDSILLRMSFANDQLGWAVGESGTIQRTIDGGATWTLQDAPTRKLFYGLAAIDDNHAWVAGAGGTILRTVDGGRNWDEQSSGVTEALRAVHFVDPQRGWAVGAKGTIISTANGGARWRRQTSGVELKLNDVVFLKAKDGPAEGPMEGWIAGDRGLLLHTTDGGATWENVDLGSRANLLRLFFAAPDCGWVVGTSGAIFKYGQVTNRQK